MDKPGNVCTQTKASSLNKHLNDLTHSRTPAHIKGSVASLRNTRVGATPYSCIPGVAVLACTYGGGPIRYIVGNPINGGPKFLYHVKHGLSSRVGRVSRVRVRVSVRFSVRYKNLGPPFIGLPYSLSVSFLQFNITVSCELTNVSETIRQSRRLAFNLNNLRLSGTVKILRVCIVEM